ncbi:MAG: hypothetical protein ABJA10_07520 [Aestuariivirga sp.]
MKYLRQLVILWAALAVLSISEVRAATLNGQTPALGSSSSDIKKDGDLEYGELFARSCNRSVTVTNPVSVNAIVLTSANVPRTALADGDCVLFTALSDNTSTATLKEDGTAVTALHNLAGTALVAAQVKAGTRYAAIYTASTTDWRLQSTGVAPAAQDANLNISANNFLAGYATTATAAGTTTLTVSSKALQFFTGVTTQTVVLPVTSTLVLGQSFTVVNNSTGAIAVNSSGSNLILSVTSGNTGIFTTILTSGTTAASWSKTYISSGAGSGTVTSITCGNGMSGGTITTTGQCDVNYVPNIRQTVATGPVDTAGLPTFLPATSASLNITSQNVTSSAPLTITAAQGAGSTGPVNNTTISTANLTWTGVTASNTNYLYVNASTGATGFTTVLPIYQFGGTPAVTNNLFTFNISEMQGYMGNGSTAPATPLVFVGEVVAGASTITSTIAYAYNGYYDSGYTATLPTSSSTSKNSNIGVAQHNIQFIVQNTTAEGNWSIGDIVNGISIVATNAYALQTVPTRTTSAFLVGTAWNLLNKTTFAPFALTVANWKYKLIASRGW